MGEGLNYTYIIECVDKTLYVGWTNNIEKRMDSHNLGEGAKYTRSRHPVTLMYVENFVTKQEAQRREWEIKQMTRKQKLDLIKTWQVE